MGADSRRLLTVSVVVLGTAILVAGCSRGDGLTTGSVPGAGSAFSGATSDQAVRNAERWGRAYERDPDDPETTVAYADSLQALGRDDHALQILAAGIARIPNSSVLLSAYGRALAQRGDSTRAAHVLDKAEAAGALDWRTQSAYGAALDQLGRHSDAQTRYTRALQQRPNSPSVMSNLGLSQALSGDIAVAEKTLRQAAALPGADIRVRQNLALVLGVQGKFEEAEQLARQDMSAEAAQENMAYLRDMLSRDDRWKNIRENS